MNAVVEGVSVGGLEVNKAGDFLWVAAADGAELLAGYGMADQDGVVDMERVDDREHVVAKTIGKVVAAPRYGGAGGAEAATGNAVDVIVGRELLRELVKDMGGVANAGEQNHGTAGPSPVEHLESDVFFDGDEEDFVRSGVERPRGCRSGAHKVEGNGLALMQGPVD